MKQSRLSHLDQEGRARMVDVSAKDVTERIAIAEGHIAIGPEAMRVVASGNNPKGSVEETARIAGVLAAKKTSELIPLCHGLNVEHVDIELERKEDGFVIRAAVKSAGRTGVEMEALTAVSVAALTVYDMLKAVDKSMTIGNVRVIEKRGGTSGDYRREE